LFVSLFSRAHGLPHAPSIALAGNDPTFVAISRVDFMVSAPCLLGRAGSRRAGGFRFAGGYADG